MEESSLRRIEKFRESIKKLKKLSTFKSDIFYSDLFLSNALERNLQIAVECIADIARKIISSKEWKIPSTYKEIIKTLKRKKVLNKKLSEEMGDLVGLRNILVHMYAEVKLDTILDELENHIKTLELTMNKILKFCKEENIDP